MTETQFENLIKKAKKGSTRAFERLLRIKEDDIAYIALGILKNERDAEDAVQEAVLSMFRNIDSLHDSKAFNAWMYKTVYRSCLHVQEKRKKGSGVELDYHNESLLIEQREELIPEMTQEGRERREYLIEKLNLLPENYRNAMYLFYFEDMPYAEIAEVMECSKNSVSNWLERGKAKLRDELVKDGITDKEETQTALSASSLAAAFLADREQVLTLEHKQMVNNALEALFGVGGIAASTTIGSSLYGAISALVATKYFTLVVGGITVATAFLLATSFTSFYINLPPSVEDIQTQMVAPEVQTTEDLTNQGEDQGESMDGTSISNEEELSPPPSDDETPPPSGPSGGENTVIEGGEEGVDFVIENKVYFEIMDEYDEDKLSSDDDPELISNKVSAVVRQGASWTDLVKTGDVVICIAVVLVSLALVATVASARKKRR